MAGHPCSLRVISCSVYLAEALALADAPAQGSYAPLPLAIARFTPLLCRKDIPRALERERPPVPDPFEIGAGNRLRSRARIDLRLFRRSASVFYSANAKAPNV